MSNLHLSSVVVWDQCLEWLTRDSNTNSISTPTRHTTSQILVPKVSDLPNAITLTDLVTYTGNSQVLNHKSLATPRHHDYACPMLSIKCKGVVKKRKGERGEETYNHRGN